MHSVDHPHPTRQRGPHNDPSMLDGDSGHGNPGDMAGDEWAVDTDTDVVDQAAEDELDDAVADPAPELDDELDEFEGGAEPDAATATPTEAGVDDEEEEEVEEEGVEEEEVEAEAEVVGEVEGDVEGEEDDSVAERDASGGRTTLEAELERQMDRTSTDPGNPRAGLPAADASAPPVDGYDTLTVPQVLEQVAGLDAGRLNAVLEYEKANRNRKTLVAKLTRLTRDA